MVRTSSAEVRTVFDNLANSKWQVAIGKPWLGHSEKQFGRAAALNLRQIGMIGVAWGKRGGGRTPFLIGQSGEQIVLPDSRRKRNTVFARSPPDGAEEVQGGPQP